MLSKWKANGNLKTMKVSIITTIVGIILTLIVSQAIGMYSWKSQIDTNIAVIKEKVDTTEKQVKSIDEKIEKIYQYIIDNGKKK